MLETKEIKKESVCIICGKKIKIKRNYKDWRWQVCNRCKKWIEYRW